MTIHINNLFMFFIKLSIFLIPLNALPYFKNIFGELSSEGSFYPLFVVALIWLIYIIAKNKKIYFPQNGSFYLMIVFFIWIFISGAINIPDILIAKTKGRTGIEKLILQMLVLIFMFYVALFIFNVFRTLPERDNLLLVFRKYIFISFLIAGFYSIFEILNMFNISFGASFLKIIDVLIRSNALDNSDFFVRTRLQSVSSEPSWFGMYLSFALPWILSYLITERKKLKYALIFIYLIIMLILTISRTAYVISIVQLILFFIFFNKEIFSLRNNNLIVYALLALIIVSIFSNVLAEEILGDKTIFYVLTSFILDDTVYELSNIGRFGSQITAFNIFLDYPLLGVGLGQYGFYMPEYAPDWSFSSSEIINWANRSPNTSWPPVHGLYARILCELGFIGLLLWLNIWFSILYKLLVFIKMGLMSSNHLLKIMIISIIGVLLAGFSFDSFRFFGYWILLGVSWSCIAFYENFYRKSH